MLTHIRKLQLAVLLWYVSTVEAALAQMSRAPSKPPDISLQKLWDMLAAKPGILIAGGIALTTLVFVLVSRGKKSKS